MHRVEILSDYSSLDNPNYLVVVLDDQGDVHIRMVENNENNHGIRIAADGTRHSTEVRRAFYALVEVYEKEINSKTCHPDICELNRI
jgi:hypothetical protein